MSFGEIRIDRVIGSCPLPHCEKTPVSEMVPAIQIIEEIAALKAQGTRVLLITLTCPGGAVRESFPVYDVLRDFSRSGGTVIVHAVGDIASTACALLAAGDLVIVDRSAVLRMHAMMTETAVSHEPNGWLENVCATRTATPREALRHWLGLNWLPPARKPWWMELGAAMLLSLGWGDLPGDREIALAVAAHLARGGELPATPRRAVIVGRPEPRSWARFVVDRPAAQFTQACGVITADKLNANCLQTSNYAEDAYGNPTAGAKLDHTGTALKVAAGNFQIGSLPFNQLVQMGAFTMSGMGLTKIVTLPTAYADDNYRVTVTPTGKTGSPPMNAYIVEEIAKDSTYFVVTPFAVPGTGNSVIWDWIAIHEFP